jgi:hypothetical protein
MEFKNKYKKKNTSFFNDGKVEKALKVSYWD